MDFAVVAMGKLALQHRAMLRFIHQDNVIAASNVLLGNGQRFAPAQGRRDAAMDQFFLGQGEHAMLGRVQLKSTRDGPPRQMRPAGFLIEKRLRVSNGKIVPLSLGLSTEERQLIISGPNTGGKTVSLKTAGLLSIMAQAGIPIPAEDAVFPVFKNVLADIGDSQSIEQNLSTFSAHIVKVMVETFDFNRNRYIAHVNVFFTTVAGA